jgi:hypothetical protein
MRGGILLISLFLVLLSACGDTGKPKIEAIPVEGKGKMSVSQKTKQKATDIGRIPTSININFQSGYWHIASAFNVDSIGDFRPYEGVWIDFKENNEFVWGKGAEEKEMGAWGWDEPKQYLYFFSDSSREFFIGEWEAKNNGDVVICVGSTPNNPRSTQYKLVRRHEKVITE